MANPFAGRPPSSLMAPAQNIAPVTKGAAELTNGVCRSLLVGTAGSANITTPDGTDLDAVPLQQGYNPIMVSKVRAGGTATDIWALY